jgi:hypothetical protein
MIGGVIHRGARGTLAACFPLRVDAEQEPAKQDMCVIGGVAISPFALECRREKHTSMTVTGDTVGVREGKRNEEKLRRKQGERGGRVERLVSCRPHAELKE